MATRNAITGDEIKTGGNSEEYRQGIERIFGNHGVQRGRYRQDKETGKFIPMHEWLAKYGEAPKARGPMIHVSNFDAFESPATGQIVRNKREYINDLKRSGSRPYEGFATEKAEADRYQKYQDQKFEQLIDKSVNETAYEMEHSGSSVSSEKPLSFTFGE